MITRYERLKMTHPDPQASCKNDHVQLSSCRCCVLELLVLQVKILKISFSNTARLLNIEHVATPGSHLPLSFKSPRVLSLEGVGCQNDGCALRASTSFGRRASGNLRTQ